MGSERELPETPEKLLSALLMAFSQEKPDQAQIDKLVSLANGMDPERLVECFLPTTRMGSDGVSIEERKVAWGVLCGVDPGSLGVEAAEKLFQRAKEATDRDPDQEPSVLAAETVCGFVSSKHTRFMGSAIDTVRRSFKARVEEMERAGKWRGTQEIIFEQKAAGRLSRLPQQLHLP